MADELKNTLPGDGDDKIIYMIRANYTESDSYLVASSYRAEQKDWHDLYRSIPKTKPYLWMSNKFIPMTMAKVDSALSNLVDILFQAKPPIEVNPLPFGNGDAYHAGIIKTLLAKQIDKDSFFLKFVQYLKNLLIYGTAIGYTAWERNIKKVTRKAKIFERVIDYFGQDITDAIPASRKLFKGYEKSSEEVVDEGPVFEPCNIGDIFPDPQSIEVNDGFLIWKIRRSIAHLRANVKSETNPYGMYNDEVYKLTKADSCENKEGKQLIESNMGRQWAMGVTREDLSTMIDICYWFGKYDLNGDGKQEQCVFALAANRLLIRKDSDIYYHGENGFIKGGYSLEPNEFFHIGIPEQIADLNDNMNETVNQRIDNITLTLNPMAKIRNNNGVRTADVVMKPGGNIGMDDADGVTWDRPPDVTQSNFAHVSDIERWAQEVSVPKITMGIAGSELNKTATGMSILAQGAMDKSMLIAKLVEATSFSKVLKLFYELDYQMLDEFSIGKLIGVDPKTIDMEKMNPSYYSIEPAGVKTVGDKNQKALKLMQAQNVYGKEPWFKSREAGKKVVELLSITDNPHELIRTEEETAQIEAERAREEAAKMLSMMAMTAQIKGGNIGPGAGPGRESTQFKGGETNMSSAGGVPPNTTPSAPEQEITAP